MKYRTILLHDGEQQLAAVTAVEKTGYAIMSWNIPRFSTSSRRNGRTGRGSHSPGINHSSLDAIKL